MNEALLVYLWGIYPQFSWLVPTAVISGSLMSIFYLVSYAFENDGKPNIRYDRENYEELATAHKLFYDTMRGKFRIFIYICIGILFINSFIPTRNVAVMMVAAPTIVEVSKDIRDSNTTKRLTTILGDSLSIIEKKVKEAGE